MSKEYCTSAHEIGIDCGPACLETGNMNKNNAIVVYSIHGPKESEWIALSYMGYGQGAAIARCGDLVYLIQHLRDSGFNQNLRVIPAR